MGFPPALVMKARLSKVELMLAGEDNSKIEA